MYDFDEAFERVGKYASNEDKLSVTINFFATAMGMEVLDHFKEEEYETVSKVMMLVSGIIGGLIVKSPNVSPIAMSNMIAIAGWDIKTGNLLPPEYGIEG